MPQSAVSNSPEPGAEAYLEFDSIVTMRGCYDRGHGGSNEKGKSTMGRSIDHDEIGWNEVDRPAIPVG